MFDFFNLHEFVRTASYIGLFLIIFAETGLLIGFFLPGDSLLITAGLIAAEGTLSLPLVVIVCALAAILGDQTGYVIGRRFGSRIFARPRSRLFHPEHVERAKLYFERFGSKTLIVARFVPIVRTFAPTMAGVGQMQYRSFVLYNVVGGLIWGAGLPIVGFSLGKLIPDIDRYILIVLAVVVVLSLIPILRELRSSRRPN